MLPLQVTNSFLLTDGSNLFPPHLSLCRTLIGLGWGCQVSAEGALLELNLPFLELIIPPVQVSVTPDKLHRVISLKVLLWIVNFYPPLVLNIGRWLIKNRMVMGYVLDGLFQALKQSSEGAAAQRKAFLKPVLPPSKMLADPQSQSMICVLRGYVESTSKWVGDFHGLFQNIKVK